MCSLEESIVRTYSKQRACLLAWFSGSPRAPQQHPTRTTPTPTPTASTSSQRKARGDPTHPARPTGAAVAHARFEPAEDGRIDEAPSRRKPPSSHISAASPLTEAAPSRLFFRRVSRDIPFGILPIFWLLANAAQAGLSPEEEREKQERAPRAQGPQEVEQEKKGR